MSSTHAHHVTHRHCVCMADVGVAMRMTFREIRFIADVVPESETRRQVRGGQRRETFANEFDDGGPYGSSCVALVALLVRLDSPNHCARSLMQLVEHDECLGSVSCFADHGSAMMLLEVEY